MIFTNEISARIAVIVLGLCGFWVAKHIRKHKTEGAPLVCPIGFDCHAVVHSDYSKFLGMPVELLGMIYYAFISLASFALFFTPSSFPLSSVNFLTALSLAAFVFSLYLISTQIFIIKKGCSWCIISSIISALIFLLIMVK